MLSPSAGGDLKLALPFSTSARETRHILIGEGRDLAEGFCGRRDFVGVGTFFLRAREMLEMRVWLKQDKPG